MFCHQILLEHKFGVCVGYANKHYITGIYITISGSYR